MTNLEENPACERTYASFRLVGDRLDKEAVSQHLGIKPDFAAIKGESRPSRNQPIKQRTGVWSRSSKGEVDSTNLERHLLYLLEILEPKGNQLSALINQYELKPDFYCYWAAARDGAELWLSPSTLLRIGDLDAHLGVDYYAPLDEPRTSD